MNLKEIAQSSSTPPIVLVFGRLCSGKGTFCSRYTKQGYTHFTTSDFVKKLSGQTSREELQKTKSLDSAIAQEMIKTIDSNTSIIIDGIRQKSIVDALIDHYGREQIELIWLNAPDDVRRQRYETRQDAKDTKSFDHAEAGDAALGLDDLESHIKKQSKQIDNF